MNFISLPTNGILMILIFFFTVAVSTLLIQTVFATLYFQNWFFGRRMAEREIEEQRYQARIAAA
jgi:hypothetical protein